jgi:hypothetical protein
MAFTCKFTDLREKIAGVANPTFGEKIVDDVEWRVFYPSCPKINKQCSAIAGAYVAAITVCRQRLFSQT